MTKSISIIPKAPCARILLDNGASRVSKEAMNFFGKVLEEYAKNISESAILVANHSGRKTIKSKDIKFAVNNINDIKRK